MAFFMSKDDKEVEKRDFSKKSEVPVSKKSTKSLKPSKKQTSLTQAEPQDLWEAFNETFDTFRNNFEDLLFPLSEIFSGMTENRVPAIDLEDREKEFLLKAEMPGFNKEDIEINAQDDAVEITGTSGWTYDEKDQVYICKERACKTFYRYVDLPEEIKVDDVSANLSNGVLELKLPKVAPKEKRKVPVK
jgi:HSP20 family protein